MSDEWVTLKQLAIEIGMDRSHLRRYVLKLGITPTKHRTPESGNQLVDTLSAEEAEHIRRHREKEGFGASQKPVTRETGFFYAIQILPKVLSSQVKLGFSGDPARRLIEHQTTVPVAQLLKSWPCHEVWEKTAIAALSAIEGTLLVGNEVFEFESIDKLLQRGDEFFRLLPDPATTPALSPNSPHYRGGGAQQEGRVHSSSSK